LLFVFLVVAFEALALKVLCALQFPSNGCKLGSSLQQRHRKAPAAANRCVAGIVRHHGNAADVLGYRRLSSHAALTLFTSDCLLLLGCSRERRHVHQVVAAGAGWASTGRDFYVPHAAQGRILQHHPCPVLHALLFKPAHDDVAGVVPRVTRTAV
jgi:hypothetical protein